MKVVNKEFYHLINRVLINGESITFVIDEGFSNFRMLVLK